MPPLQLLDLLPRENVFLPLEAASLREALLLMVRRLAEQGEIRDREVLERLLAEERPRGVVAIEERVVLPHFRTEAVDRSVVALGISPVPLPARDLGLDASPQIVVLILAPPEAATLYLRTVSTVARLLKQEQVVERILQARSPDELLALPEMREVKIQPRLSVRDVMVHQVDRVTPDTPVQKVVDIMVRQRLRAIPVVGEKQEVLGIISEWDVMRALLPHIPRVGEETGMKELEVPPELNARDIMTRSVLCISEELGVDEVAHLMINKDVEQFPVVSEGKLTGFLTRGDLIRKLFAR